MQAANVRKDTSAKQLFNEFRTLHIHSSTTFQNLLIVTLHERVTLASKLQHGRRQRVGGVNDVHFRQLKTIPRELRNHIYEFTLSLAADVIIPTDQIEASLVSKEDCENDWFMPKPALLAVYRQIRAEATLIYYASNTFRAVNTDRDPLVLVTWIINLTSEETKWVRKLVIETGPSKSLKTVCEGELETIRNMSRFTANAAAYAAVERSSINLIKDGPITGTLVDQVKRQLLKRKRAGIFDLSSISFEATKLGDKYDEVGVLWAALMGECLEAVKKGQDVDVD